MKTTPVLLSLILLAAVPAMAADDVMPPPAVDEESLRDSEPTPLESAPDLRDELDPDASAGANVRSYQREGATFTEYSLHGRVYKIRVQPAGGAPEYYLYDSDGDGNFERRLPGGAKHIVPPTWVLKEF